ncbi:alpha-mannosidase At3g26720-like isoform X2 [Triticum dicoccoides]|uniref:alpha-mannosidase At3g26720-like isoform X2 n=1 Tax=Triticum dicoccoides TaxID=85692 RepID=UPI00188ED2EA|nr:alpha-mannosidase At3g26720-like isoform X2 [Triticum dicoccoides]
MRIHGVANEQEHGSSFWSRGACVQNVLDSLVSALLKDENRKLIYVEKRWWRQQNDIIKGTVKGLVSPGRLEFINRGMCMHDEATVCYIDMIDQTTLGHRFINEEFSQIPRIGWQIDPFGHSTVQAYPLSAEIRAPSTRRYPHMDCLISSPL